MAALVGWRDVRRMSQVILPSFSLAMVAGAVDYIDIAHGIRGWLVNVKEIGNPQNLRAHFNGDLIATSVAILDRPDIDEVLKATTQCGFLIGWSRFNRDKLSEIVNRSPDAELSVDSLIARLRCLSFVRRSRRAKFCEWC